MRVAIVGGGIMGLCTAWACRREGWEVAVFDQGPIPNPLASSMDQHRLIRYPYGAHTGYGALVGQAYEAWAGLLGELGPDLYVETGTLALAHHPGDFAHLSRAQLKALGVPFRVLSRKDLARDHPHLLPDGVAWALHTPTGGVLLADRILSRLSDRLEAVGVSKHPRAAVSAVEPHSGMLHLEEGGSILVDRIVVAAGPWTSRLVPALAPVLTPSRQVTAYLEPPAEHEPAWESSPMLLDIDSKRGFYAVPPVAGTQLKVADHRFTLSGDPDCDRNPTDAEAQAAFDQCQDRFHDIEGYRLVGARTCFYTAAPNERFRVEAIGRAVVMSPCSGHGFKFGPLLGMAVAETLAGRRSTEKLRRLAAGGG